MGGEYKIFSPLARCKLFISLSETKWDNKNFIFIISVKINNIQYLYNQCQKFNKIKTI